MKFLLFTDGGSRGNPGPSGAGAVLCQPDGAVVAKAQKFLGAGTNNEAEYAALILGLELALENGATDLSVFMDSKLVAAQMSGDWKIKKPEMRALWERAQLLAQKFSKINFRQIPRERNTAADALANAAMNVGK